ncbi:tetratricopeptide repeat protein [Streptomyces sp. JJ66]|uniref:tetratricopeptide repeat protein n=1 Tax=Streptomyces sp. JJ66 TaxID=2803843 RepID=UPI001C5A21BA|nr:tetratricopeptide repeat protein [Streptomyces sp. JJ66]MBW1601891.1 tetratricopeptide repeat protein [Streptomyces sp. JJ66]
MSGAVPELRDQHRAEAEQVLARAVEEEVRRSGGTVDGGVLLARGRASLTEIAARAGEEYAAYTRALDAAGPGRLGERFTGRALGPVAGAVAFAAVAVMLWDREYGSGQAIGAALVVAAAGVAGALAQIVAAHLWDAQSGAGARHQPGGVEQLRLAWLTALEVRGVRPYLEQQRIAAPRTGSRRGEGAGRQPQLRGQDRSAAARRRTVLAQSFAQLPAPTEPFAGRKADLARIAQWVHQARASTQTRPTVVVLHGVPGSGRTALALHAAHELRDQFRGACLVDLRGDTTTGTPLGTRDALLHLLNRLGAPREQLLFRGSGSGRERPAQEQQVRRLAELYHQHLAGVPVTVVLDDATDPAQVAALVPERSDSLVIVTTTEPLQLPPELTAWVHHLALNGLEAAGAEELLRTLAAAPDAEGARAEVPYDAAAFEEIAGLCGGLPFGLRLAGSALADAGEAGAVARKLAAYGPPGAVDPVQRALTLRYADQSEAGRRLLRRLALAGRASLGAAAAGALLGTDEPAAARELQALARAGLLQQVRGQRYKLHGLVRRFALARLREEEDAAERAAAQERLIRSYAELADTVIRMVDGNTSTRSTGHFGGHGFTSLESALRWLDEESSFITAALRHTDPAVDQSAVLHLLGALCDYCLLHGDLYRLGELSDLAEAVDQGLLTRSVQWRTGIAARQLGELDRSHSTLSSVVSLYLEADHQAGAARTLRELGITLHHQGQLPQAADKLREALQLQSGEALRGDRAWTLHALAAVERDRGRVGEALTLLREALEGHRFSESVHGQAWTHFQLGQTLLRTGEVGAAESELHAALEGYRRSQDGRGEAWALTELARARLYAGEASEAVEELHGALVRHRESEDPRGAAWTRHYLGLALEETGNRDGAVQELERARAGFSRMRDVYGLACARHHLGRVSRDQRAASSGSLRNSGFARQLLQDARGDFQRIGVAHGEAWSCLELAVIDAGNGKLAQALGLADAALELFAAGYGEPGASRPDLRGGDWARFLRCTLLPLASPGGSVVGTAVAQEELAELLREDHSQRDPALADSAEAYALMLERGVEVAEGWRMWDLGMVPTRHSREVMGVPLEPETAR